MQGQEYLNQISASNRPVKQSKLNGILTSKWVLLGVGFFVLLIIIMIIGSVLSGNKGNEKDDIFNLDLHLTNTIDVINEYQPNIKSSKLRGNSSSLNSVLASTKSNLDKYLTEKYKISDITKDASKDSIEEATTAMDDLSQELFEAKINGILDRVYAHKMAYEITLIASEEKTIMSQTSNDTLKSILSDSYESLDTLYDEFNNFSETK